MEIWKEIKGFEGLYKISNLGRVKNLKRKVRMKGNIMRTIPERIKKPQLSTYGYHILILYKNNKHYHRSIHRLIAESFIQNPENKPAVNHKDGVKTNNSIDNLEWATYSEDRQHAYDIGLNYTTPKFDGDNPNSRSVYQYDLRGNLIAEFNSLSEASRQTMVLRPNISHVCRGTVGFKTAGGYKWKYKN